MLKKMKQIYNVSIVFSILLAVFGVIMILVPEMALDVICKIFAVFIIARGLFLVVINFQNQDVYLPFEPFTSGIISIIMGIVLLIHPNYFEAIAGILVGLWIVIESINDISISIKLSKTEVPWLITLILAILSLIAGIILLFNPQKSAKALVIWSGIILIINSITSCIDKFIFKKYVKEIKKNAKKIIKTIDE